MSVFGALNRFIARLDDAPQPKPAGGESSFGFQVLRNRSQEVPLEPWFDYVVGINGRPIDNPDPNLFANEVRNCGGASVSLTVWSAKGQRVRDMYVGVPSDGSLGLTLQWTALDATASVWHILEVAPHSPADAAGLLPYGDYIIGSPEGVLRGEAGLGELVEEFLGRPMRLWVYNHEYGVCRTLTLTPARGWGGEGALGCVLGFGHLHRLPAPLEEGPPTAAGETMFESAKADGRSGAGTPYSATAAAAGYPAPGRTTPPPPSNQGQYQYGQQQDDLAGFAMSPAKTDQQQASNFITPADMVSGPPKTAGGGGGGSGGSGAKKANRSNRGGGAAGFDEIFAEGEKKSAAVDNAPKTKATGAALPPPPPKARSPAPPPSGTGTPKPETRSPGPITEEGDE